MSTFLDMLHVVLPRPQPPMGFYFFIEAHLKSHRLCEAFLDPRPHLNKSVLPLTDPPFNQPTFLSPYVQCSASYNNSNNACVSRLQGSVLYRRVLHTLLSERTPRSCRRGLIVIPILQTRKLRPRDKAFHLRPYNARSKLEMQKGSSLSTGLFHRDGSRKAWDLALAWPWDRRQDPVLGWAWRCFSGERRGWRRYAWGPALF